MIDRRRLLRGGMAHTALAAAPKGVCAGEIFAANARQVRTFEIVTQPEIAV